MRKNIKPYVLTSIFAALCFVALYIMIPIPAPTGKQMIHLGNLIVIIVSFVFGGFIGGAAGSIGMGLFDLLNGYADSAIFTLILKFGIGLVAGCSYKFLAKRPERSLRKAFLFSAIFFLIISITSFIISLITKGVIDLGVKNNLIIHWAFYVFNFVMSIILFVFYFLARKIPNDHQFAITAALFAVCFNIIGEFLCKTIKMLLVGNGFKASVTLAFISLPATAINASLCVILVAVIYPPISRAMNSIKEEKSL